MLIEDNFIKIRSELILGLRGMDVQQDSNFESLAIKTFRFQAEYNSTYKKFIELLNITPTSISEYKDIPFLPVEAFREHKVTTGEFAPEIIYKSSGTTDSGKREKKKKKNQKANSEVGRMLYYLL